MPDTGKETVVRYRVAIGRAINAISNDCLSDGMRGKAAPCEQCTRDMAALRALAALCEQAEWAAAIDDQYSQDKACRVLCIQLAAGYREARPDADD